MTSNISVSSLSSSLSSSSLSSSNPHHKLPDEMKELLLEFSIAYLIEQPHNLVDFAVQHFRKLQKSPTIKQDVSAELRFDDYEDGDADTVQNEDGDDERRSMKKNRRKTIFATGYSSENDHETSVEHIVHAKTTMERKRLSDMVKSIFIFRSLDEKQLNQVLDSMFVREVKAGECVMKQGGQADNCYIIESGKYRVFKNGKLTRTYDNNGIFGDLALLYNQKRAATVNAETDGKLWAVDRATFRRILLKTAYDKRKVYEKLLNNTPILNALSHYERMNLADALISRTYKDGDMIFKQGDEADGMYFIIKGVVSARNDQAGNGIELTRLQKGQYFGELGVITHRPRAASLYAVGGPVECAFIDTDTFDRMLGFLTDVLKRNVLIYEQTFAEISQRASF